MDKIIVVPDHRLSQKCAKASIDEAYAIFYRLVKFRHEALGIAAPQLGIMKQVAFIFSNNHLLVNPEIVSSQGWSWDTEGCLSIPRTTLTIGRHTYIKVKTSLWEAEFYDVVARVIQHEIDHLNGILITDRYKEQHVERKEVSS